MVDRTRTRPLERSLVWLARIGVAMTFVVAAAAKIADPAAFATAIANFQAFPHWSWNLLATVVPMMELVGAVTLLGGYKRRAGAWLLGMLTVGFLLLITSVLVRGIDVSCGCFGRPDQASTTGWPELLRNVLLLAGVVLAAQERPRATPAEAT